MHFLPPTQGSKIKGIVKVRVKKVSVGDLNDRMILSCFHHNYLKLDANAMFTIKYKLVL